LVKESLLKKAVEEHNKYHGAEAQVSALTDATSKLSKIAAVSA
jgi:hypothetical protein